MNNVTLSTNPQFTQLLEELQNAGILVEHTNGKDFPKHAMMHDHAAPVPSLVISPASEAEVTKTLATLHKLNIYDSTPISVKAGGHGYFNGASCDGIMINLTQMQNRNISGDVYTLQPGSVLAQTVYSLFKNNKIVPHGDCFGVGAGGHFTTAGWDGMLTRKYGLGCQSVMGGRIALWDGSIIHVDENNYPDLLWAMRGGAAAGIGVVTELKVKVQQEPDSVSWCMTKLSRAQIQLCVDHQVFEKSADLPREISMAFRVFFEDHQLEPICSFNISTLYNKETTLTCLEAHFGKEIIDLIANSTGWSTGGIVDYRMIPASDYLTENPERLGEVKGNLLREDPLKYWEAPSTFREMADSFFTTLSSWVLPQSDAMILKMYDLFETAKNHPLRSRMYTLVVMGRGAMQEKECAMPLGDALSRFELHWDEQGSEDEIWAREFTKKVYATMLTAEDKNVSRPYRGDIWKAEQAEDDKLDRILEKYDTRQDVGLMTA